MKAIRHIANEPSRKIYTKQQSKKTKFKRRVIHKKRYKTWTWTKHVSKHQQSPIKKPRKERLIKVEKLNERGNT